MTNGKLLTIDLNDSLGLSARKWKLDHNKIFVFTLWTQDAEVAD